MASKTLTIVLSLQDNVSSKLIKISDNFANLSKVVKSSSSSAKDELNKLKSSIIETASKASESYLKMINSLGKRGVKIGLSKALDLEEYKAQLESATHSTEKASELMEYSINMAGKTPFESSQIIEASAKLESMGLSAKNFLGGITDMAAGTKSPLKDVTKDFVSAQGGKLDALESYGIKKTDILKKADEMFANQQAIDNKGQITNEENYNKVLQALMEERYGGSAEKFSKTTKGMLKTITDITKNSLAQIIGIQEDGVIKSGSLLDVIREKLMMVMDKLNEWKENGTLDSIANTATAAFKRIYSVVNTFVNFIIAHPNLAGGIVGMGSGFAIVIKVAKTLSKSFDSIKSSFDTVRKVGRNLSEVFHSINTSFNLVSNVGKALCGVFKSIKFVWGLLSKSLLTSPTGIIIIGIIALVAGLILLWQKCEGFRNLVTSIGQTVMTWFQGNIMPILQSIFLNLQNLWNTVLVPFGMWLISTLGPIFQNIFLNLLNLWNSVLVPLGMWLISNLGPILQSIFSNLLNFWNTVLVPFGMWLISTLAPIFTAVFTAIWNVVSQVFANIGIIIEGALTVFNGIIEFITGIFTGNWSLAWEGVKEIFSGIFNSFMEIAKVPLNYIIDLVNYAITSINSLSFTVPDWVPEIGGSTIGLDIPEIPHLATGSNYTKKGLTLVGEHGPELVNMPGGAKVNTNSETNRFFNGGNNRPIQIYVDTFIGEESFADKCGEIVGRKVLAALNNM